MTEFASAIGIRERHHDEMAFLHLVDVGSDGFDDADGFVSHSASLCGRCQVVIRPEIAAADTGSGDANKRVSGLLDCGVGHVLNSNVPSAVHNGCTHTI